jgi:2-phospho-L-lactate guanylyltransferase
VSGAVWAVVVARTGPTAKSRLSSLLTPAQRSELAQAMLADVLGACAAAGLAGMVTVADEAAGRRIAAAHGALVMFDPGTGMNGAISTGLRAAAAGGAETAIVLPGDVPLVAAADLEALLAAAGSARRALVVAVDRHGTGSNALLLRPARLRAPAFGVESAPRHLELGRAAGAETASLSLPGLALDVDTPDDLAELRARVPGGQTAIALAGFPAPHADRV